MLRLRRDLHVNLMGATIILDLLERLEAMESELARWRRDVNEERTQVEEASWIPIG